MFQRRTAFAAFTLIELLVVIAIISLLAAILFPVFAQARAKGRQAVCQSNLKQIGLAIQLYQQDFDGYYVPKYNCITFDTTYPDHCVSPARLGEGIDPPVPEWLPAAAAPTTTEYLLKSYLKSDDVRRCPSRHQGPPRNPGETPAEGRYVINAWDSSFSGRPETGPQGQPDSDVRDPAGTLIVWEHTNNASECQVGQPDGVGDMLADSPGHWEENHSSGLNGLWCDGHVKWMKVTQFRRHLFTIQQD